MVNLERILVKDNFCLTENSQNENIQSFPFEKQKAKDKEKAKTTEKAKDKEKAKTTEKAKDKEKAKEDEIVEKRIGRLVVNAHNYKKASARVLGKISRF